MMYKHDQRVVMTLDAGGTNFVFSAIKEYQEVVTAVQMLAVPDDLNQCLEVLVEGFNQVKQQLTEQPVAISFAFPGPADYENGVIGDLGNLPAFRGGVALGSFLEKKFGIPVYINNDGNLFAYGEALAGGLPIMNQYLKVSGSSKRFQNLIGITLGTGFGSGVVIDSELLKGDNGCGGDVWNLPNAFYKDKIAEESVSIRAVKREYAELTGNEEDRLLTPKEICEIADGVKEGNQVAAIKSFERLGKAAGDAIAYALAFIDGLVVVGGGVAGAYRHIFPALTGVLNERLTTFTGMCFPRLQMTVYDMTDPSQAKMILQPEVVRVKVPGIEHEVDYRVRKSVAITVSSLGTNRAISLGAYVFALHELDKMDVTNEQ